MTTDPLDADGIEIVSDLFDSTVRAKLVEVNAKSADMCTLFQYFLDSAEFAEARKAFGMPRGDDIVIVPNDYPYHLYPIDTMSRSTPEETHSPFPGTRLIESWVLVDGGLWSDLR